MMLCDPGQSAGPVIDVSHLLCSIIKPPLLHLSVNCILLQLHALRIPLVILPHAITLVEALHMSVRTQDQTRSRAVRKSGFEAACPAIAQHPCPPVDGFILSGNAVIFIEIRHPHIRCGNIEASCCPVYRICQGQLIAEVISQEYLSQVCIPCGRNGYQGIQPHICSKPHSG